MKTIQISKFKSSNLNPQFAAISTIEIEDTPFDSGAYGEVYILRKIDGRTLFVPQVVKVFIDDGSGSSKRGLNTIELLQEQIIKLNNELKNKNEKPIESVIALCAIPQFSYQGRLGAKTIIGYSANLLDSNNWLLFDKIFNERDSSKKKKYRDDFYTLPLETRLDMAYNLVEGFSYLEKMKFVYADLNPKNFFVNLKGGQLCLIDYEGGAVMDSRGNTPETYGKQGEWLAPEIQEQLLASTSGLIKVDLNTDTWAVAIGIHFLLFPYHPFFYLKTRGEKEKDYFKKYKWAEIDRKNPNYRQEADKPYDKYLTKLKTEIPKDLVKVMSDTFNDGYANPSKRLSYKQWVNTLKKLMNPPAIIGLKADKQAVLLGHSLKISWQVERARTILLNGQDVSGTTEKEIRPTKDEKYKLKVSNSSGTAEQELWIKVLPVPIISSFITDKTKIGAGDSITLNWKTSNVSKILLNDGAQNIDVSNKTEYKIRLFRTTRCKLIATGLDNKTSIEHIIELCVFPNPEIIFFEAEKEVILDFEEATLKWQVKNAKSIEIDNGIGKIERDKGKILVKPATTTKYTITAKGELSNTTKEVIVRIFPTPIIESLLVPMLDFESRIDLNSIKIESPQIDIAVNIPEFDLVLPDFNLSTPKFIEQSDDWLKQYKSQISIFNLSKIHKYVKNYVRKRIKL